MISAFNSKDFHLFETILWNRDLFEKRGQGFWLLKYHLERLKTSSKILNFRFIPTDIEKALLDTQKVLINKKEKRFRVKLILNRDGRIQIDFNPFHKNLLKEPVLIDISPNRVNSNDEFLYHKTSSRTFFDKERKRLEEKGLFETIFLNEKDELTQGTITNLFLKTENKKFLTPPLSSGLLPGVLRKELLSKGRAMEKVLYKEDLFHAKKIYIGNSLRGLIEAKLKI